MNRKEAVKFLKQIYPYGGNSWLDQQRTEAIGMAITALSNPGIDIERIRCKLEEVKDEKSDIEDVVLDKKSFLSGWTAAFIRADLALIALIQKATRNTCEIESLWKEAQGDDLPDIDREVIVLLQDDPDDNIHMKVAIGHRPNPKGWDGKSLLTGEVTHYDVKTYDKGGWNQPNVVYWLDLNLPKKNDGDNI